MHLDEAACYYFQIILASSMTSDVIMKVSREVESVDEEECNKRGKFVERPLFHKCCNYYQTPYCSQRKMKNGAPKGR